MTRTFSKPRFLTAAQALFLLNAIIWLVFGIIGIARLANGNNTPTITLWIVTLLMFGNVSAMLLAGWWLGKTSKWAFFFALAVLLVNILLTFTDQVGFFDIITALLDMVLLGIILYNRKQFT